MTSALPASTKDLDGKIAVITGANSGIGLEATVQLAQRGATVVMCCRTAAKALEAREDALKRSGADEMKIHFVQLDLADLDNIESFRNRYDAVPGLADQPVHMLILNAGVMALPKRQETPQGIEMQFGTNVVGHFKFAAVMIDLCKKAELCRIVSISSITTHFVSGINFTDINREKRYSAWSTYAQTKLANFMFVVKLNRILEEKGISNIVAVGAHPGYSMSNLHRHSWSMSCFAPIAGQSPTMGAKPTVLAATDPNAKRNGYAGPKYLSMRGPARWNSKLNKAVWNQKQQDQLWEACEKYSKAGFIDRL